MRSRQYRGSCLQSWQGVTMGLVVFLVGAQPLSAQATDRVEMSRLGERGAVFEAPLDDRGVESAWGAGDMNGDGIDDIALSVAQQPGPFGIMIVFGRPGLTGRTVLSMDFPGSATLRVDTELRVAGDEWIEGAGDLNDDGFADLFFSYPRPG